MLFRVTNIFTLLNGLLKASALCTPPTDSELVITSQIEGDALGLCDTLNGSLYINATGSIRLDGITNITGSLSAGGGISALTSDSLLSIGGTLLLDKLSALETLSFSNLLSVGSLSLTSLPSLRTLSFGSGLQNLSGVIAEGQIKRSFIVNGTGIQHLGVMNFPAVDDLIIENNADLGIITLGLEALGNNTLISRNGNETALSIPFLRTITGNSTIFSNLRDITIPRLVMINGNLDLWNNQLSVLNAESLTSVSGTLNFQDNESLQNISAPVLKSVGELVIQNNPSLRVIDGFDSLENASTGITLLGNQSSVTLSNLRSVENFSLETSYHNFSCDVFDQLRCRGIIADQYECQRNTTSTAAFPSSCSNSVSSGGLTLKEKLLISFGVLVGVLFAAFIAYLCLRRSGYSLLRYLRLDAGRKAGIQASKHRRIDSNVSDIWFDTSLEADTRYLYINGHRVVDRATPTRQLMEGTP